jgi:hypothetical protein
MTCESAEVFDEIVMFGDSLSDNGNLISFGEQYALDPELYYQSRLSNELIWVEYLSNPERLNISLNNRAFGGAETGGGMTPPDLIVQVTGYIADTNFPFLQTHFLPYRTSKAFRGLVIKSSKIEV